MRSDGGIYVLLLDILNPKPSGIMMGIHSPTGPQAEVSEWEVLSLVFLKPASQI